MLLLYTLLRGMFVERPQKTRSLGRGSQICALYVNGGKVRLLTSKAAIVVIAAYLTADKRYAWVKVPCCSGFPCPFVFIGLLRNTRHSRRRGVRGPRESVPIVHAFVN